MVNNLIVISWIKVVMCLGVDFIRKRLLKIPAATNQTKRAVRETNKPVLE